MIYPELDVYDYWLENIWSIGYRVWRIKMQSIKIHIVFGQNAEYFMLKQVVYSKLRFCLKGYNTAFLGLRC
jgi:hypothetical protein